MTPAPVIAEETIAADESAIVGDFVAFMKEASAKRYLTGTVGRFNQARAVGCV